MKETFSEFVKRMTRKAHDGLLMKGGKGLEDEIYHFFYLYDVWKEENEEPERPKPKKKVKRKM